MPQSFPAAKTFQVIMDLDLDDKAATLISASFDGFVKAASSVEMAMVT